MCRYGFHNYKDHLSLVRNLHDNRSARPFAVANAARLTLSFRSLGR